MNEADSKVKQARIMNQTRSNHKSIRIELWFELGPNLGRAWSNHDWNRVQNLGQTGSSREMNEVDS